MLYKSMMPCSYVHSVYFKQPGIIKYQPTKNIFPFFFKAKPFLLLLITKYLVIFYVKAKKYDDFERPANIGNVQLIDLTEYS